LRGTYRVEAKLDGNSVAVNSVPVYPPSRTLVDVELPGAQIVSERPSSAPAGAKCTAPILISGPGPIPPDPSIRGCFVIRCVIDRSGAVRDCREIEAEGNSGWIIPKLEQRKYEPFRCDGKPYESDYTYRIYLEGL
jgi:hypothetical protein